MVTRGDGGGGGGMRCHRHTHRLSSPTAANCLITADDDTRQAVAAMYIYHVTAATGRLSLERSAITMHRCNVMACVAQQPMAPTYPRSGPSPVQLDSTRLDSTRRGVATKSTQEWGDKTLSRVT